MADHPLRPATDRRLGGPLPHQPANQTRVHLIPPEFFTPYHAVLCAYAVLAVISNRYPPVWGRLPTRYSPVRHSVSWNPSENFNQNTSFDLHVLGTPPAFILSQDQTLMFKFVRSKSVWLILPFYCCFRFLFWIFSFKDVQPGLFFYSNFQGFTYCSIFDFQGSLLLSVSAATHLVYQILFCLSTTFFIYFWTFLEVRAPFSRGVYYNNK